MDTTSPNFKENARKALADPLVARSRGHIKAGFIGKRRKAADRLPEFEALRDFIYERMSGAVSAADDAPDDLAAVLERVAVEMRAIRELLERNAER